MKGTADPVAVAQKESLENLKRDLAKIKAYIKKLLDIQENG